MTLSAAPNGAASVTQLQQALRTTTLIEKAFRGRTRQLPFFHLFCALGQGYPAIFVHSFPGPPVDTARPKIVSNIYNFGRSRWQRASFHY